MTLRKCKNMQGHFYTVSISINFDFLINLRLSLFFLSRLLRSFAPFSLNLSRARCLFVRFSVRLLISSFGWTAARFCVHFSCMCFVRTWYAGREYSSLKVIFFVTTIRDNNLADWIFSHAHKLDSTEEDSSANQETGPRCKEVCFVFWTECWGGCLICVITHWVSLLHVYEIASSYKRGAPA